MKVTPVRGYFDRPKAPVAGWSSYLMVQWPRKNKLTFIHFATLKHFEVGPKQTLLLDALPMHPIEVIAAIMERVEHRRKYGKQIPMALLMKVVNSIAADYQQQTKKEEENAESRTVACETGTGSSPE